MIEVDDFYLNMNGSFGLYVYIFVDSYFDNVIVMKN